MKYVLAATKFIANQATLHFRDVFLAMATVGSMVAGQALAWDQHAQISYLALEKMPEVAHASRVAVEPIDTFLRAEEKTLEALLASQEAWAIASLDNYPPRPANLAFMANPSRSDEARRQAFLTALRVAPNSKLALFLQPDMREGMPAGATPLTLQDVSTGVDDPTGAHAFFAVKPGDLVNPIAVVASATDEPYYGLDTFLWDDNPGIWGKQYGLGSQPFGNPNSARASQTPFYMGFFHEDRLVYSAAAWAKRSLVLARYYQYSSLASLAFRTGHDYWAWRFTGMALHYVQNLTQPYHASLAPGESSAKVLSYNALARMGLPRLRNELVRLLGNRRVALDALQAELLPGAEKALQNTDRERSYPDWTDRYLRDVVAAEAASAGNRTHSVLLANLPAEWVAEALIDLQPRDENMRLLPDLLRQDPARRAPLQALVNELMGNLGVHSRNALRAIVKSGNQ